MSHHDERDDSLDFDYLDMLDPDEQSRYVPQRAYDGRRGLPDPFKDVPVSRPKPAQPQGEK